MASNAHVIAFPSLGAQKMIERARTATREITIASGLHSGATFSLQDGELIVIGADVSCDICLSDAGIAPRHVAITLHGPDLSIRSLDSTTSVNGENVVATKRVSADESLSIGLGTGDVRLELPATPAHRASGGHLPRKVAAAVAIDKPRAIALLCFLLFAIIATVLVAGKLDASLSSKPAVPDTAAVRALLDRHGLPKTLAVSVTSHGAEIKGVLDREAATKLRSAIASSPFAIIDSVVTKEDLAEQVRNVFRTQGYDANVTSVEDARVHIDNLDETHERVRRAAEQVRADVPQIEALIFASPNEATPPADPPSYGNSAGDRIVPRIDGKTAYLVAGAGTRYFTGSKLPSGHTIRRITREAVQLERDGQIGWFRF